MALTKQRSNLIRMVKDHYGDRGEAVADRIILMAIEDGLRHVSKYRVWEFLGQQTCGINPIPSYEPAVATMDATVVHDTTLVTFSTALDATQQANVVGSFIEIGGVKGWYEVVALPTTSTLTLARPFRMPNGVAGSTTSNVAFKLFYPFVELPLNFRKRTKLYDVLRSQFLAPGVVDELWAVKAWSGLTSGQPLSYAVKGKDGDPNVTQMLLYPAPTAVQSYELSYVRHAGWWSTNVPATSTWKMRSTSDDDYVDWPESKYAILEMAILAHLYIITKDPAFQPFTALYQEMLDQEAEDDQENGEIKRLGDDASGMTDSTYAIIQYP